ncbi:MAG TPA: kelch repeat-containing protein [Candidatus Binataceae bacterium]|nr:kelch repeat-containing protein [Candidatus Binataceae bacterium]
MQASTITAYAVDPNSGLNLSQIGTGLSASDGSFAIAVIQQSNPVRIAARGGSFVSEMNGATIGSPSTQSLLLASSESGITGLSLNPLATFVDSRTVGLLSAGGTNFTAALSQAKAEIEKIYGLSSDPGLLQPDYTHSGTDAANLGLILGALINEDQQLCPNTPGGLVSALSADISDGIFDGLQAGAPLTYCQRPLPALAGIVDFQDALSGLGQLQAVPGAFAFGGTNNVLTTNGLANLATGGTISYPLAPLLALDQAIGLASPASINGFASAAETPMMENARAAASATLLLNNRVLIAGGEDVNGVNTDSSEIYDSVNNCFAGTLGTPCAGQSLPSSMNTAREFAAAVLLPNGNVLIAGGQDSSGIALASTEIYDAANNCFAGVGGTACASETAPAMNTAREFETATLLPNGKVLIAGGDDSAGNVVASTELYDPVHNCFAGASGTACASQTTPVMVAPREYATASLLPNGKVLIAGGQDVNSNPLNSTELYDPSNNCFAGKTGTPCATQSAPSMAYARYLATAAVLPNGKVLIAGGYNRTLGVALQSSEIYDPTNNCFAGNIGSPCQSEIAPGMSAARYGASATLLANGKVLIAGGANTVALASTELYDPVNNCFAGVSGACAGETAPTMNSARYFATATLLPNGLAMVAGGFNNGAFPLASVELYTP